MMCFLIGARVAETGFLLTASRCGVYDRHAFDLKPYMAAFPMLLETFGSLLNRPEPAAGHQLHSRCTTCWEWLPCCYRDVLENEPVQFLPGLTRGPCALAWRMVPPSLDILEDHLWTMADEEERQRVWREFSQRVSAAWHKSIASGKGPHIFASVRQTPQNSTLRHTSPFPASLFQPF